MAKETVTMDRYGHLFPSDDHKAAMDAISGELIGCGIPSSFTLRLATDVRGGDLKTIGRYFER
jgi:hypothetical protein